MIIVVTTIPVMFTRPHRVLLVVASTVVRLAGDAMMVLYLSLVGTTLVT